MSVPFSILDNGGTAEFAKSVTTLRKSLIDNPQFAKEEDKFVAMDGFVRELKNPARKGKFGDVPADVVQDTFKITDEYVTTAARVMTRKAAEFGDVRAEVMPDGRLMFNSKNAEHAAFMNREYATRINDSIAGLSNIMNISHKEAAKMTYPRYKDLFTTQNQAFGAISKSMQIPPEVQRARDAERLAILKSELALEMPPSARSALEREIQLEEAKQRGAK